MDLQCVEHLHKGRGGVVYNLAVTQVQLFDLRHLFPGEGKVPHRHVLLHPIFVDRFGDNHHPPLEVPAQRHLGGGLAMLFANSSKHRMGEDAVFALGKGAPGFGNNTACQRKPLPLPFT